MKPEGSMPPTQGLFNKPYPVPRIDTYFFNIYTNNVPQLCPVLSNGVFPEGLSVKIVNALLSFHRSYILYLSQSSRFKHAD